MINPFSLKIGYPSGLGEKRMYVAQGFMPLYARNESLMKNVNKIESLIDILFFFTNKMTIDKLLV